MPIQFANFLPEVKDNQIQTKRLDGKNLTKEKCRKDN